MNSATIPVRDIGGGRITVTAQVLTTAATTATVRATAKTYGGDVTAQFSAAAARTLGHGGADQLLIQANEAVNIIPAVRVFQNTRNAEARGTILPIDWGASTTGLADMLGDTARQRIYIANPGLNRLEVFDMQKQAVPERRSRWASCRAPWRSATTATRCTWPAAAASRSASWI